MTESSLNCVEASASKFVVSSVHDVGDDKDTEVLGGGKEARSGSDGECFSVRGGPQEWKLTNHL